jgi:hypothetical protein
MKKRRIRENIEIAIGMLGSSIPNRYGNGRISHSQRNFITATVTQLLEEILNDREIKSVSSITRSCPDFNPPDES